MKVYHGTLKEFIKNENNPKGYLYVTDTVEHAKQHAKEKAESLRSEGEEATGVVLEIDLDSLENVEYQPDNDIDDSNGYKTAEESFEKIGTFVIVGKIPIESFPIIWEEKVQADSELIEPDDLETCIEYWVEHNERALLEEYFIHNGEEPINESPTGPLYKGMVLTEEQVKELKEKGELPPHQALLEAWSIYKNVAEGIGTGHVYVGEYAVVQTRNVPQKERYLNLLDLSGYGEGEIVCQSQPIVLKECEIKYAQANDKYPGDNSRYNLIEAGINDEIQKVIKELGLEPYDINNGYCDVLADEIEYKIPGAESVCTENFTDSGKYPGHIWIYYKGRHYDAESPEGVKDWKELPIFKKVNASSQNIEMEVTPFGDLEQAEHFNPAVDDFEIKLQVDGETVGYLQCYYENGKLYAFEVSVESHWRRKGFATKMYDYAEEVSGKTILPHLANYYATDDDSDMSEDAYKFWINRIGEDNLRNLIGDEMFNKRAEAGISDKVYHFTTLSNASKIMSDDRFTLSPVMGTDMEIQLSKNKLFYFSTSREKFGGYTRTNAYSSGVVFNLDGRKLSHNYSGDPVDYWGRDWRETMRKGGSPVEERIAKDENEDRVYSDKPEISPASKYIDEIHILLKVSSEQSHYARAYQAMIDLVRESKLKGIPVFIYDNVKDFKVQNKDKSLSFKDFESKKEEKGDYYFDHGVDRAKRYYNKYFELYHATDYDKLSKEASKLAYNLLVGGMYLKDIIISIKNDIHNSKSSRVKEVKDKVAKFVQLIKKSTKGKGVDEFVEEVLQPKAKQLYEEKERREEQKVSSYLIVAKTTVPDIYLQPEAMKMIEDEIGNMAWEIEQSQAGRRGGVNIINPEDNDGYMKFINTTTKSTFPPYLQEIFYGNGTKKKFLEAVARGKGEVYNRIVIKAIERLENGYQNQHGYDMPNEDFLELVSKEQKFDKVS